MADPTPRLFRQLDESLEPHVRDWKLTDRQVANRALRGFDEAELRRLAFLLAEDYVRDYRRGITRSIERDSVPHPTPRVEIVRTDLTPEQKRVAREWKRQLDEKDRKEKEEREARFRETMERNIRAFKEAVIVEWTQELLETPFALGDGRRVLWGDATRKDHQQRIDFLTGQMVGTAKDVVKHIKAVEALENAGAKTLREMVQAA